MAAWVKTNMMGSAQPWVCELQYIRRTTAETIWKAMGNKLPFGPWSTAAPGMRSQDSTWAILIMIGDD
eukprot:6507279-Pyramimonas_sp.AAC.1